MERKSIDLETRPVTRRQAAPLPEASSLLTAEVVSGPAATSKRPPRDATREVVLLFRKVFDSSAMGLTSARAAVQARADVGSNVLVTVEVAKWR